MSPPQLAVLRALLTALAVALRHRIALKAGGLARAGLLGILARADATLALGSASVCHV